MNVALTEKIAATKRTTKGQRDRRNGYYERSLLTAFGYIEHIQVPRGRATSIADVVRPQIAEDSQSSIGGCLSPHDTKVFTLPLIFTRFVENRAYSLQLRSRFTVLAIGIAIQYCLSGIGFVYMLNSDKIANRRLQAFMPT